MKDIVQVIDQMHLSHPAVFTHLAQALAKSGEDGVLVWLDQQDHDVYPSDIRIAFDLTPGRITNIIRSLENKGYIQKLQDAKDLRRTRLFLTDAGKMQARLQFQEMHTGHQQLVAELGEADAENLIRFIEHLIPRWEQTQ